MDSLVAAVLIAALFVAGYTASLIHAERKNRRLKAQGKPTPETPPPPVNVYDWSRR